MTLKQEIRSSHQVIIEVIELMSVLATILVYTSINITKYSCLLNQISVIHYVF